MTQARIPQQAYIAVRFNDGDGPRFGTDEEAQLLWDATDADANHLVLSLPSGGAVNVPAVAIGVGLNGVDTGVFDGLTGESVLGLFTGVAGAGLASRLEMFRSQGTNAIPTTVISGDDLGAIRAFGHHRPSYLILPTIIFF